MMNKAGRTSVERGRGVDYDIRKWFIVISLACSPCPRHSQHNTNATICRIREFSVRAQYVRSETSSCTNLLRLRLLKYGNTMTVWTVQR